VRSGGSKDNGMEDSVDNDSEMIISKKSVPSRKIMAKTVRTDSMFGRPA